MLLISQRFKTVIVYFRGGRRHRIYINTVRIYCKSIFQDGDHKPEVLSVLHITQQDSVEIVVYQHRMFSVNRVETIYVVIDVIVIYRHICIRMMIAYVMLVRIVMYTASVGMPSIV